MEWFLIYLFVMIERISSFFMTAWVGFWLSLFVLAATFFACFIQAGTYNEPRNFQQIWNDKTAKSIKFISKSVLIVSFMLGCIGFLLPTQKDAAIIIGTGLTYEAVTSEAGKRIGGKAVELLEQKVDEALKSVPDVPKPREKKTSL